jgi:hypothetical protein
MKGMEPQLVDIVKHNFPAKKTKDGCVDGSSGLQEERLEQSIML